MIYAISDIHGDISRAKELLGTAGVIDNMGNWIAGESTLVVCGDSTDRGPHGLAVLYFVRSLQEYAPMDGGTVIHLMGNHDAMMLSIALGNRRDDDLRVFSGNGGDKLEAIGLIEDPELLAWMQEFPLMAKVDDYLFQHCDQFTFYNHAMGIDTRETRTHTPTAYELIMKANEYGREQVKTWEGAWGMFCRMTDERRWNQQIHLMPAYLEMFKAQALIHGHTRNESTEPTWYEDNLVCNIDATLSIGYRSHQDRGCVLQLNTPGAVVVV